MKYEIKADCPLRGFLKWILSKITAAVSGLELTKSSIYASHK
jgi:hypothetical protein